MVKRTLYNTVRAGISMQGNTYFYVNPLEVWPARRLEHTSCAHVKPVRQKWFDVACCPTNIVRTFTSLGQYIYSADESSLFVNLFIRNEADFSMNGRPVHLSLETDYPRTGRVAFGVSTDGVPFRLCLRIPGFAERWSVLVNGEPVACTPEKGYFCIDRTWNSGDTVSLEFDVRPRFVFANPAVHADSGKLALIHPSVPCALRGRCALRTRWRATPSKPSCATSRRIEFSAENPTRYEVLLCLPLN